MKTHKQLLTTASLILALTLGSVALAAPGGGAGGNGSMNIGPATVVDSLGNLVGLYDSGNVLRKINGVWFTLFVAPTGFTSSGVFYFYPSADCSGTPYIRVFVDSFTIAASGPFGGVVDNTLYYPNPAAIQSIELASANTLDQTGTLTACCGANDNCFAPVTQQAAPVLTFDLSTFVPPLSLKAAGIK